MKKLLLLLACVLFSISASNAQNYTISQGQEFAPPDDSKWAGYAGENNTNVFILRIKTKGKGTKYFLESINKKTLQKQYEAELPLEEESNVPCRSPEQSR